MFWAAHIRKSRAYYMKDRIETYYLGGEESDKRIVFYDKIAEMKRKGYVSVPKHLHGHSGPVTRIEVRLRHGIRGEHWHSLSNPFEKVGIARWDSTGSDSDLLRLFRIVCQEHGAQHALYQLSKKPRAEMKQYLDQRTCTWWSPSSIWLDWSQLRKALLAGKEYGPAGASPTAIWSQDGSQEISSNHSVLGL